MMARAATQPQILPLLVWDELRAVERLRDERRELMRRVGALPVYSHRRVVLEARLVELTARLLTAEARLHR